MKRQLTSLLTQALLLCCLASVAVAADDYEQVKSDIQAGRTEAALVDLRSMVQQQPGDYQAWFLLGVATARQQQYHQSIEAFRRVIELNAALAEPHNNLAVIYNELGDVRAAVGELEQSLKKRPGYAIAEENLADLYVKLALENYRNALAKEPRPALEQRYARLLQVRDPDVVPEAAPKALPDRAPAEPAAQVAVNAPVNAPVKAEQKHSVQAPTVEPAVEIESQEDASQPAKQTPKSADAQGAASMVAGVADKGATKVAAAKDSEASGEAKAEASVLAAVERWRRAWSGRDLAAYFAAYDAGFEVPARFASLAEWRAYKQRVIASKSYIEVELSDLNIEVDGGVDGKSARAKVKFFQKFRSNSYTGDDLKVLEMKHDGGEWKIVKEESLS